MPNPSRKTVFQLIIQLMLCASGNGNFMLNTGPTPDGEILPQDQERYRGIGEWLRVNGEAIYGTHAVYWPVMCAVAQITAKGNSAYLLMPNWPKDEVIVSGVGEAPVSANFLRTGDALRVDHKPDGRLILRGLPKSPPDKHVTVVKLKFDRPIQPKNPADPAQWVME